MSQQVCISITNLFVRCCGDHIQTIFCEICWGTLSLGFLSDKLTRTRFITPLECTPIHTISSATCTMHISMVHLEGTLCRHPMCNTLIRYFIYIYCSSTRFLCQMVLVSFISNMTVSQVEHDLYAYLTRTPELFNGFVLLNVFCIVIRRSLFFIFVLLPISAINNDLLWITASDYPIAIFKLFVQYIYQSN